MESLALKPDSPVNWCSNPNTYTRLHPKNRSIRFQILKSRDLRILIFPPETPETLAPQSMHPLSCLVCGKETEAAKANFCQAHSRALDRLRHAYSVWTTAYGSLSVSDFFKRVRKLPGTGQNAKEIVEFLERNPARWK